MGFDKLSSVNKKGPDEEEDDGNALGALGTGAAFSVGAMPPSGSADDGRCGAVAFEGMGFRDMTDCDPVDCFGSIAATLLFTIDEADLECGTSGISAGISGETDGFEVGGSGCGTGSFTRGFEGTDAAGLSSAMRGGVTGSNTMFSHELYFSPKLFVAWLSAPFSIRNCINCGRSAV